MTPEPDLLLADLVLTRGPYFWSALIRRYQRTTGEAPTKVNHIAGVTWQGNIRCALITEALVTVREHSLWRAYAGTGEQVAIFRNRRLTPAIRFRIAQQVRSYIGRTYGVLKLAGHLGDWWLSRLLGREAFLFRRLTVSDHYPICTWPWALAYRDQAGIRFRGVDSRFCQPDDVWDEVTGKPEEWERVRELGRLG